MYAAGPNGLDEDDQQSFGTFVAAILVVSVNVRVRRVYVSYVMCNICFLAFFFFKNSLFFLIYVFF